jgi:hypothetical protein
MAYNDFSSVPLGNQITTGNSAGTGLTAFDAATSGTDAAMVASSDFTIRGKNSLKVTSGATSANNQLGWNAATLGSTSTLYLQSYFYIPALPAVNTTLFRCTQGGTTTLCGSLILLTTGMLRWTNSAGATITNGTLTTAVQTGAWIRVQAKIVSGASTGQVETKLYNNSDLESTTPTSTITSGTAESTGPGTVDTIRATQTNPMSNFGPMYWADLDVRTTGYADALGTGVIASVPFVFNKVATIGI